MSTHSVSLLTIQLSFGHNLDKDCPQKLKLYSQNNERTKLCNSSNVHADEMDNFREQ